MTKPKKLPNSKPVVKPLKKPTKKTTGKPVGKPARKKSQALKNAVQQMLVEIVQEDGRPRDLSGAIFRQSSTKTETPRSDARRAEIARYVAMGYSAWQILQLFGPPTNVPDQMLGMEHPVRKKRDLIYNMALELGAPRE